MILKFKYCPLNGKLFQLFSALKENSKFQILKLPME
jgi:hypothetical protein